MTETMQISVNNRMVSMPAGSTLADAMALHSPYGEEAVICRINGGKAVRSIDDGESVALHDADCVEVFPLVIGG